MGNKQMITDKDREELIEDLRAYNDAWVLEEGKDRDRLIEFESAIRAESAEQARKEAAERAVKFVDNNYNAFGEWDNVAFDNLRAAILGDPAPVSTDSEKLGSALDSGMNCVTINGNMWIYTIRDGWILSRK